MQRTPIKDEWLGEKTFIIGGGPSVKEVDLTLLQGKGHVIVTNNAYKIAPYADWLVFSDSIWYSWHKESLKSLKMPIISGGYFPNPYAVDSNVVLWRSTSAPGLITQRGRLTGRNAGHMAISLAEYLGSKKIILIGFDMSVSSTGETQWHNEHKRPTNTAMYLNEFIPEFTITSEALAVKGVDVYNVNKNSALKCFPYLSFENSLDI